MSINTKIRLAILASSVALAAAAPAAFAGTAYAPEGGKADATAAGNTGQATQGKLVPIGAVPDTGAASSYKPEGGTTDATGGLEPKKAKRIKHMKHVKHMKAARSGPDASVIQQQPGVPKN